MDEELPLPDVSEDLFNDDLAFGDFGDLGGGTPPISKHSELLKELTNFDPLIARRIRNWLGLEWDDKMKSYQPKNSAIINETGARWAIGFLQTYQAKPNIITNINQREFENLQMDIIKIVWMVFPCHDNFGVKGTSHWYRLCTELDNSAFLVLAGAGDGKYTKFLGETVSRTENVQIGQGKQASGGGNDGWANTVKNKLLGRG